MDHTFSCPNFDPEQTFFCGQAFRFYRKDGAYHGIVGGRRLWLTADGDSFTLKDINDEDIPFWRNYLDLDTDYGGIIKILSRDEHLKKACAAKSGIRILRQDPFETLISFIISQNNNIKRIGGIIERLCQAFGEKTSFGYLFPTPQALYGVDAERLSPLRAGFRAKYIADAVQKLQSGEVDLSAIRDMDTDSARAELKKIKGVGDKVADCVLLFGYYRIDAFPKDVWIKRVCEKLYPNGLPDCIKGYEGIAQQYLFDYARSCGI